MKYVAREIPPGNVDFSWYFEDDGFKGVCGALFAIYIIPPSRRYAGYNLQEFDELKAEARRVIDDYEKGYAIEAELAKWAEYADPDSLGDMLEYLTLTTGAPWHSRSFRGYSQGDYCEVIYCVDKYTEGAITQIGNLWLGCATEFSIDGCRGYFVIDELRWEEGEKLRQYLADCYGCEPEEMEIYLYDGERIVTKYKKMD